MEVMGHPSLPEVGQTGGAFRPSAHSSEVVITADFSENISAGLALLLINTLVFGQYIPPRFIHTVVHTQICMYIHTYQRVINWIFVHVCVHTFS